MAAGTVALVRGYESGPWILGLGLAGAATTGYLRVAADAQFVLSEQLRHSILQVTHG